MLIQPATGTAINVGTIAVDGTSVSTQVNVNGANLTETLSVSVSGTGFSVSPTTLTAEAVNSGTTVTVTYNGIEQSANGTLTLSSSEVNRSVSLTAGKAQSGDDPVIPTGDYDIEDWEGCNSGGYWTSEVQGAAFKWQFTDAGLWAQANDHWNGQIGCRFGKNTDSSIAMIQDVAGTSGLSFYAATYGTSDADATLQVLYSTDGGSNWTMLNEVTLTHELVQYTYSLDVTGNVRFKFQQTAGKRLNIDDIAIYAPAQTQEPKVYFGEAVMAMQAVKDGESTISEAAVITEDNDEPVMVNVEGNFELSLDQQSWTNSLTLDASGETFYVRLASTTTVGEYEGVITATAGEVSAYAEIAGTVSAPNVLIGDVNMDGTVTITDVTALIDYLLGGNPSLVDLLAADVSQDGNVAITDLTTLIDVLLGDNSTAKWNALPAQGGIRINNPVGESLEVYNLDADVVARVQTSTMLSLPEGIYMVTSDNRSRKVIVR